MRADKFELIEDWIAKWDDLIEFEIVSVQDSPTKVPNKADSPNRKKLAGLS